MNELFRAWLVRRRRERLADAEHYRTFLHVPSQLARQDRRIARLRSRVAEEE